MMRRGGFRGAGLVVLLCAALLHARPGVVRTRDGQTFEGEVDERNAEEVVVTVRNIPVRVPRTRVAEITYPQSFEQQFAERMAKLDSKDAAGRIALAREAMANKKYALARDALESSLQIDNNNAEAVNMLETVRSLMRLERRSQLEPARPPAAEGRTENRENADPAATHPTGEAKVLTPAQINAIKQAEMRPDDRDVRIRFERNVLRRFVEYNSKYQPGSFFALNPMQQAQIILAEGLPEMRQDIIIVNDPPALLHYRRMVQPYLLTNCATTGCHGGAAPKFNMVLPADNEPATYTNFYILTRYVKPVPQSGSVFGRGNLKLVDRQRPAESLLLQYSLPPQIAVYDHVEVPNYHPPMRGVNDPKHVQILNWIAQSLQPVDPDYGFEFGGSATQPSTVPATTQAAAPEPAHPAGPARPAAPPTARPAAPAPAR